MNLLITGKNVTNIISKRERIYRFIFILLKIYLAISLCLSIIYLIAPLVGGKLFMYAVIIYASQSVMSLVIINHLNKTKENIIISKLEWISVYSFVIICTVVYIYSLLVK